MKRLPSTKNGAASAYGSSANSSQVRPPSALRATLVDWRPPKRMNCHWGAATIRVPSSIRVMPGSWKKYCSASGTCRAMEWL